MKPFHSSLQLTLLLASATRQAAAVERVPFSDGMLLGQGFNTFLGSTAREGVVTISDIPAAGAAEKPPVEIDYRAEQVTDYERLLKSLDVNAAASISGAWGSGSVNAKFLDRNEFESSTLTYLVKVDVQRQTGTNRKLTFNWHTQTKQPNEIYGDRFISDFVEGGSLFALVSIVTTDTSKHREIEASAKAAFSIFAQNTQVSTDVKRHIDNIKKHSTISVDYHYVGAPLEVHTQFKEDVEAKQKGEDELLQLKRVADAFVTRAGQHDWKRFAVLEKYANVPGFEDQFKPLDYNEAKDRSWLVLLDFTEYRRIQDMMQKVPEHRYTGGRDTSRALSSKLENRIQTMQTWVNNVAADPEKAQEPPSVDPFSFRGEVLLDISRTSFVAEVSGNSETLDTIGHGPSGSDRKIKFAVEAYDFQLPGTINLIFGEMSTNCTKLFTCVLGGSLPHGYRKTSEVWAFKMPVPGVTNAAVTATQLGQGKAGEVRLDMQLGSEAVSLPDINESDPKFNIYVTAPQDKTGEIALDECNKGCCLQPQSESAGDKEDRIDVGQGNDGSAPPGEKETINIGHAHSITILQGTSPGQVPTKGQRLRFHHDKTNGYSNITVGKCVAAKKKNHQGTEPSGSVSIKWHKDCYDEQFQSWLANHGGKPGEDNDVPVPLEKENINPSNASGGKPREDNDVPVPLEKENFNPSNASGGKPREDNDVPVPLDKENTSPSNASGGKPRENNSVPVWLEKENTSPSNASSGKPRENNSVPVWLEKENTSPSNASSGKPREDNNVPVWLENTGPSNAPQTTSDSRNVTMLGAGVKTDSELIKDSYIVVLKDGLDDRQFKSHLDWVESIQKSSRDSKSQFKGVENLFNGKSGFRGYGGTFSPSAIASIRKHNQVALVEQDQNFHLSFPKSETENEESDGKPALKLAAQGSETLTTQSMAPHSLRAISHRSPPSKWCPRCFYKYYYDSRAGEGNFAYVFDSGVRTTHKEFEGRAKNVWTRFSNDFEDKVGHGTHVAGIIASKTYGVAKKAQILSVKVTQDGRVAAMTMVDAFNWAANDIVDKGRQNTAVINMSIGIGLSESLNAAIDKAFEKGVLTVAVSGNRGSEVWESPGSARNAITVGSINPDWTIASYSDFGPKVNILAPGSRIKSTARQSDGATEIKSGTSMAAPHVAGLVLNAMSVGGKKGASQIKEYLYSTATKNQVKSDLRGSPNLVANNDNANQRSCKASDDNC